MLGVNILANVFVTSHSMKHLVIEIQFRSGMPLEQQFNHFNEEI